MLKTANNSLVLFSDNIVNNHSVKLKHGDTISVKILNLKKNGTSRIFLNGKVFEGIVSGNLKEGDIIKMNVVINNQKIFLVPQTSLIEEKKENIFLKLGLPQNEISSAIISFLMTSEMKLNKNSIIKLLNFLKKIDKNKKQSVFTACLLENKNIELQEDIFNIIDSLIFGGEYKEHHYDKDGFLLSENYELLELLNHQSSKHLHWIVLPFKKEEDKLLIKGSLCLLLDISLKTCRKFVLHCKMENEDWVFMLQNKLLTLQCENKYLTGTEMQEIEKMILLCLQQYGLTDIQVRYGIIDNTVDSIDLRV